MPVLLTLFSSVPAAPPDIGLIDYAMKVFGAWGWTGVFGFVVGAFLVWMYDIFGEDSDPGLGSYVGFGLLGALAVEVVLGVVVIS
jgi:hypothetical protein